MLIVGCGDREVVVDRIGTAKRLLLEAMRERGALSRRDLHVILREHPELVLDDLDVAVTQLSAEHQMRHSVRGFEPVLS